MLRSFFISLLIAPFSTAGYAHAKERVEDVVVLRDSAIIRGTILGTMSPGSTVTVKRSDGRVAALLWSEILTIKRLPVNMPDALIVAFFMQSETGKRIASRSVMPGPAVYSFPSGPAAGDTTDEDVLVLAGGSIVRGTIIEAPGKGSVGFWTSEGKLSVYHDSDVRKKLRLPNGTTDSTIDVMYINPPPELIAGDFRVLTVFGGSSFAGGEFAAPRNDGGDPAGSGFALGLHASVRLVPALRWATSAIFARNAMRLPSLLTDYSASGDTHPHETFWLVTGGEIRTEGTSALRSFAFVQGGLLFSRIAGFDVAVPETRNHPSGVGGQEGASSKGLALCIGGGISFGRFSLTGRWLTSTVAYSYKTTINFAGYGPVTWDYAYDQPVNVVLISAGFSPF